MPRRCSVGARLEARVLMMSTNNVLHPANGQPIIVPSQDIVLGLYYLSLMNDNEKGEGMAFGSMAEIDHALAAGAVTLHAKVKGRITEMVADGTLKTRIVETTPGRMKIGELLPHAVNMSYDLCNKIMVKRDISKMIDSVYRHCGQKEAVVFADRIMQLGFHNAYKAGISFGKDDIVIPVAKAKLVATTRVLVKEYEQQYSDGLITQGEKYNKVVDAWQKCNEKVTEEMMSEISAVHKDPKTGRVMPINSIYMMSNSGARGSVTQMRQLGAMRGLMSKPSGEIIETPIISNFKEGLSVLEYFNSTHGARKGLSDTALKTANSGYLTRRLVDVAQDAIISEVDCGTKNFLTTRPLVDGGMVIVSLGASCPYARVMGPNAMRYTAAITRARIVTGGRHTCLLSSDGRAYCWGGNDRGQLGTGGSGRVSTPTPIATAQRFTVVAPGLAHSCAIDADGAAWCWGENDHGQLGERTTTAHDTPTLVAEVHRFRTIVAGAEHSCALDTNGAAWCWGANDAGQLGGADAKDRSAPVAVAAGRRFVSLDAGWNFTCALDARGQAFCWGDDRDGQLGDGGSLDRRSPAAVQGRLAFMSISAGNAHACGVTTGGDTYCWGANGGGQLGDGSTTARSAPTRVGGETRFVSVTTGAVHSCALTAAGEAFCWGRNTYGQLGDGGTQETPHPCG